MQGSLASNDLHQPPPMLLAACELPYDFRQDHAANRTLLKRGNEIVDALLDLAVATLAIRRASRVTPDAQQDCYFYHYSKAETFDTLFPSPDNDASPAEARSLPAPRLLLSPASSVNDLREGEYFFSVLGNGHSYFRRRGVENIQPLIRDLNEYRKGQGLGDEQLCAHTASLCVAGDDLNLWRFYGDAKGVAFGIHSSQFDLSGEERIEEDFPDQQPRKPDKLYRVSYGDDAVLSAVNHILPALQHLAVLYDRERRRDDLREHMQRSITDLLSTVAFLFKIEAYAAEREYRLLRIMSQHLLHKQAPGDVQRVGKDDRRLKSQVELVHESKSAANRPIILLAPKYSNDLKRSVTVASNRVKARLPDRHPEIRPSERDFRG